MKHRGMSVVVALALAVVVAGPMIGKAQDRGRDRDRDKDQDKDHVVGVQELFVNFGRLNTPTANPLNHFVDFPNGTVVNRGGTVVFLVTNGGHGVSVYPVSKNTTADDIRAGLCPERSTCDAAFLANAHVIMDGKGDVVAETGTNPPFARVDDAGRILVGSAAQATGTLPGRFHQGVAQNAASGPEQIRIKFSKPGRYLVICMNRIHALNDWMFGLFDVVGDDDDK